MSDSNDETARSKASILQRLVRWVGWLAMLAMVILHGVMHLPGAAIVWLIAGRMEASNWLHDETDQGIEWLVKNFPANAEVTHPESKP